MDTKTFRINIPEDFCTELQKLHYDYNGKRDIIAYMISNNYDTTSSSFRQYEEAYQSAMITYQAAKKVLQDSYILPHVEGCTVNWEVDFDNFAVEVTKL